MLLLPATLVTANVTGRVMYDAVGSACTHLVYVYFHNIFWMFFLGGHGTGVRDKEFREAGTRRRGGTLSGGRQMKGCDVLCMFEQRRTDAYRCAAST